MSAVPISYANIEVRTERMGELQMALMAAGFSLSWVETPNKAAWVIEDDSPEQIDAT